MSDKLIWFLAGWAFALFLWPMLMNLFRGVTTKTAA